MRTLALLLVVLGGACASSAHTTPKAAPDKTSTAPAAVPCPDTLTAGPLGVEVPPTVASLLQAYARGTPSWVAVASVALPGGDPRIDGLEDGRYLAWSLYTDVRAVDGLAEKVRALTGVAPTVLSDDSIEARWREGDVARVLRVRAVDPALGLELTYACGTVGIPARVTFAQAAAVAELHPAWLPDTGLEVLGDNVVLDLDAVTHDNGDVELVAMLDADPGMVDAVEARWSAGEVTPGLFGGSDGWGGITSEAADGTWSVEVGTNGEEPHRVRVSMSRRSAP